MGVLLLASALSACTAELGGVSEGKSSSGGSVGGPGGGAPTGGVATATGGASGGVTGVSGGGSPGATSGGAADSGEMGGTGASLRELPCDVEKFLVTHCESCHDSTIPARLVTQADLVATSEGDPTRTLAVVAVERLKMTTKGMMPPKGQIAPSADEIALFEAWVNQGAKPGACSTESPPPDDPFAVEAVCTSAAMWTGGNKESPRMNPGQACIACHTEENEGPRFEIAGTLYPTAHEPDNCNGQQGSSTVFVEVTDADNRVFRLTPNAAGNFSLEDPDAFTFPYSAKVVQDGKERVMVTPQDNGDCNACHTQDGTNDAPGRIILP